MSDDGHLHENHDKVDHHDDVRDDNSRDDKIQGSSTTRSRSSSTTSSLSPDSLRQGSKHDSDTDRTESGAGVGKPMYHKDVEFLREKKNARLKRKQELEARRKLLKDREEAKLKYKKCVEEYLQAKMNFAMVLGAYFGRTIPVNNMKYHLRDFKELLKDNHYEVYIDPSPGAFKKRSVDIKLNKKEKLTLGRRVTMKLGVSKKKVSPQDKKILNLIISFDEMYEAVDGACHAWWKYKELTNKPQHCMIEVQSETGKAVDLGADVQETSYRRKEG
ncbi:hypothetical protein ACHWQZ_G015265 [Mnemiopsis leidyi]